MNTPTFTHAVSSRRIPSRLSTRASIAPTIHLLAAAIAMIAAVVAMSGCAPENKDSLHSEDNIALTPFSMESCASGASYRGETWAQTPFASYNAVPYGYGNQSGCAYGSQPMCDGQYGLVCVPTQVFGQAEIAWWSPAPVFSGYSGYGHVSQQSYYHQGWANGPGQIGRTCRVGAPSCGYGARCQPLGGYSGRHHGHGLGVCVR